MVSLLLLWHLLILISFSALKRWCFLGVQSKVFFLYSEYISWITSSTLMATATICILGLPFLDLQPRSLLQTQSLLDMFTWLSCRPLFPTGKSQVHHCLPNLLLLWFVLFLWIASLSIQLLTPKTMFLLSKPEIIFSPILLCLYSIHHQVL